MIVFGIQSSLIQLMLDDSLIRVRRVWAQAYWIEWFKASGFAKGEKR